MNLHSHVVLIVEDEIFIAVELEDMIRDAGGAVAGPAMTVPEAFRLIETQKITVAILDVHLRDHDSSSVARRLEAAGIPFIFHTGNGESEISSEWPRAPIVKKPATPLAIWAGLAAVTKK